MKVYTKCSNYASNTCPCELAEEGKCIVCSMNRGEEVCDCSDTVSYCIEQELIYNGRKAKAPHADMEGKITYIRHFKDGIRFIRFKVPDISPFRNRDVGTYVFLRVNGSTFYDVPISIIYDDLDSDSLAVLIKIVGVKTSKFRELKVGDSIIVRGPYYNGVMGRKEIAGTHDNKAYVLCKGIGFIPSIHVIADLKQNNNEVKVYLDKGDFDKDIINTFSLFYDIDVNEMKMCNESGSLTEEFGNIIDEANREDCNLIHLGFSDYLIKKSLQEIKERKYSSHITYINNAKLCCGEGICGSCTKDVGAGHTVHFCKEQLTIDIMKRIVE